MTDSRQKLVDDLLAIAERISNAKISDAMKDAIFGHVLKNYKQTGKPKKDETDTQDNGDGNGVDFDFNNTIKRLMRTYKLEEDDLRALFHLDSESVDTVIPELKVKSSVEGIRQCLLLIALKQALQTGKYSVIINDVRNLADNFGVYDSSNFSYAMKQSSDLLKNYKTGKDSELSGAGIKAAAELVQELKEA